MQKIIIKLFLQYFNKKYLAVSKNLLYYSFYMETEKGLVYPHGLTNPKSTNS